MSGVKVDVTWSPHHTNRFITVGSEIQLYEITEAKEGPERSTAISVSEKHVANLLTTNSDHPYLKCSSWYPKRQHSQLLALGLANGKAVLSSFEENTDDLAEFGGREFIPKHSRPCNCISWNPSDSKLLACGLEKNRTDHCVLVWDVTRPVYATAETVPSRHTLTMFPMDTPSIAKPAVELGMSESAQSLHWFNNNPQLIVCGMNNKHIKIYDLRDSTKHQNSTPTKAVYGVCVDPYFEHRLASVVENLFVLWDVRNFEKPVVTTHEQKQIMKLCWCPTRWSVLAALMKDSNAIKLYNIQSSVGNDELEPSVVERSIQPFGSASVMSFAWHPAQENRVLVIDPSNQISDYTVFDQVTMSWSARSEVVWTCGKKFLHFIDSSDRFFEALGDISVQMRRRACKGYGLNTQKIWLNAVMSEDTNLHGVWMWLDYVKSYRQDKKSRTKNCPKYEGVHTIICGENGNSTLNNSEPRQMSWVGPDISSCRRTRYVSEERERSLQLCGWGSEADSTALFTFLEKLESENSYLRAAAIAVFNLNIETAIEILDRGASSKNDLGVTDLNAVAMALAGYTDEKTALWRKISSDLKTKLGDPHLRSMFTFLIEEGDDYDEILNEDGIAVQDKLALALIYLPDTKLAEFLDKLKSKMSKAGNLDGILLTGLTNDGIDLVQVFVDITADVQTASLIVLHTLPSQVCLNPKAIAWVEAYRDLLDQWRLWKQRALFDVMWHKASPQDQKPIQQVFMSCTFCGKSVSSYLQHSCAPNSGARFPQLAATSALKTKQLVSLQVTSCPNCRKPLPRCSLCLRHMGTPAGMHWKKPVAGKSEKKLTEFSNWLTWCQTCRHGGHSVHILSWFDEHAECTITGCTCKCMSLDAVAKLNSDLDVNS